jgi:hypothetical protein
MRQGPLSFFFGTVGHVVTGALWMDTATHDNR